MFEMSEILFHQDASEQIEEINLFKIHIGKIHEQLGMFEALYFSCLLCEIVDSKIS